MINKTILPALIIIILGTAAMFACESPSGTEDKKSAEEILEVTEEEGTVTMVQVLIDRDLVEDSSSKVYKASSGAKKSADPVLDALEAEDYVSAEFNDQGTLMLRLWMDPDGELIPNGEWRDANPEACDGRLRYMKGAEHLLNFKVHASVQQVTAQFIDVETGKIEKQEMAQGNGDNWYREAIEDSWDQLYIQTEKAETPCGDKMKLDLIFDSRVKHEEIDEEGTVTFISEVESEIELEYVEVIELSDGEEDWFEGTGALVFVEYTTSVDGTCTVPDGEWRVLELTIPEMADDPVDSIELRMYGTEIRFAECSESELPAPPIWFFDFGWLRADGEETHTSTDPEHYVIRGWEAVPDDSNIIARKVYDQTLTHHFEETMILTEKTTLELRRRAE